MCRRIERYLDAVRSTLLFAKSVILVEGDAELILIPILFKKVFNISLDEVGISLINMSSTVFSNIALLFDEKRIQRKCAIITDLDTSIMPINSSPDLNDPFVRKCINSEEAGQFRKAKLDEFCENNEWVNPFYATHTFEVDFIIAGNSSVVTHALPSIYQSETHISNSKVNLETHSPHIAGREVLRLAEKEGKGWLSLLLAEHVDYKTVIPDYILRAIAFTCEHFTEKHFEMIADYRLKSRELGDSDLFECFILEGQREGIDSQYPDGRVAFSHFIPLFKAALPHDPLSKLLNYMGR